MKHKPSTGPITTIFTPDEFAAALRDGNMCVAFQSLQLSGPEGTFSANGSLVSRDSRLVLEYSPSPSDGSSIPQPSKSGFQIQYDKSDFWFATGTTVHGLNLHLRDIMPPFCQYTCRNDHMCFKEAVRHVEILPPKPSEEAKAAFDNFRAKYCKSSNEPPAQKNVSSEMWAYLANMGLLLHNSGTKTEVTHPFFKYKTGSEKSDCFVGDVNDWNYCFAQEEDDIALYLRSKDSYDSPNPDSDRLMLDGLLSAFGFMHGTSAIPWRVKHHRDESPLDERYVVDVEPSNKGPRPVGGRMTYSFGETDSIAARMMNTMAAYFSAGNATSALMRSYHWQLVEVAPDSTIRLHRCLHLCAILEGIAKHLLVSRFNWTKSRLKSTSAMKRFESIAAELGLPWTDFFEPICSEWKNFEMLWPTGISSAPMELGLETYSHYLAEWVEALWPSCLQMLDGKIRLILEPSI